MQLESLASELPLDVFEFLNGVHLLLAFHGLNSRIDNLLYTHFRYSPLDFQSVSKSIFNLVCQQHLPSMVDRIASLRLSDDNESPQQTPCFLSHHLTLSQFTHLRLLSLCRIRSQQIMNKMIDEISHLPHLTHLSIIKCYLQPEYFDSIWRLPELTHCKLGSAYYVEWPDVPTVKSLSIENVSILHPIYEQVFLERLLECTPCLRRLSVDFMGEYHSRQLPFIIPSMEILTLSLMKSTYVLDTLVQHLPNLCQLTVRVLDIYVDGYQWEKIITNHLSKLKMFRLTMRFLIFNVIDSEKQLDRILDSFRTRFWIDEHQWFVRCHWQSDRLPEYISYGLYTLPYSYHYLTQENISQFKSTCPHDDDYNSYDCVRYLVHVTTYIRDFHFSKLRRFHIYLPVTDDHWSLVPTLDCVTVLQVALSDIAAVRSQLQALLNRAPRLYSLKLYSLQSVSSVLPVEITSTSIRRLDFELSNSCFHEQACTTLILSPLSIQCQVLTIRVKHRTNILYLVKNMKSLQALNVSCLDDKWVFNGYSDPLLATKDELVEYLQQHLSPTCTISRNARHTHYVRLWIR